MGALKDIPVCEGVRQPQDCKCYNAVMRTFKSMGDEPHNVALEAALRVYRYHHPEDHKADAFLTVQRWTAEAHVQ
ncbi:MAG: hypothetical protein ACLFR0_05135 [Alphaproteobacteria bacterium]